MVNERMTDRSGFNFIKAPNKFFFSSLAQRPIKVSFMGIQMSSLIYVFCFRLSTESGVTSEERRLILEEHNYLRQTVATGHVPGQPSAQNMQEMQWDNELAAKAQQWANECTFQHDPSRYLGKFAQEPHKDFKPTLKSF
jgi:Cysteine-rich secretory protein family